MRTQTQAHTHSHMRTPSQRHTHAHIPTHPLHCSAPHRPASSVCQCGRHDVHHLSHTQRVRGPQSAVHLQRTAAQSARLHQSRLCHVRYLVQSRRTRHRYWRVYRKLRWSPRTYSLSRYTHITHTQARTHAYAHTHTHRKTHTREPTHTHTHTHTHTRTQIYTQAHAHPRSFIHRTHAA